MSEHFDLFLSKRVQLQKSPTILRLKENLETVLSFLMAQSKLVLTSGSVNQMLKILHDSAVKNNDTEALKKVDEISKQLLEVLNK